MRVYIVTGYASTEDGSSSMNFIDDVYESEEEANKYINEMRAADKKEGRSMYLYKNRIWTIIERELNLKKE